MSHTQVLEFNQIFDVVTRTEPKIDVPEKEFRFDLIFEEVRELGDAIADEDFVEIADALGDIIYVVYGAGLTFGLNLEMAVASGRELAESLGIFKDTANGLLSDTGRHIILDFLRKALDSNNPRHVQSTLATIIVSVEYAALFLDIPLTEVVDVIHESNLSKLGEDGKPIFFEYNGARKVGKGPNYKPPTEDIKRILGVD